MSLAITNTKPPITGNNADATVPVAFRNFGIKP